ncbi:MAG: UvrD-helicase domain-containing protein [Desulfotomaculales bacterium]
MVIAGPPGGREDLTEAQRRVVEAPPDDRILVTGPTGAGKTTALIARYHHLVEKGIKTDHILVLAMNRPQIHRWRTSLNLPAAGPLNILTYFGFVQRELKRFWPLVEASLPPGRRRLAPLFLTTDAAQYFMELLVEEKRRNGGFRHVISPVDRVAIQVNDSLNKAAVAGIDHREIGRRLRAARANPDEKAQAFDDVQEVLVRFREACLSGRILSYGLSVDIYRQLLMSHPDYRAQLPGEVHYLFVDNLEESVPAAQDLIALLLDNGVGATLAFNPDGGHTVFWGADPAAALTLARERCRVMELPGAFTCRPATLAWSAALAEAVINVPETPSPPPLACERIAADLRSDMLLAVGEKAMHLVRQGTPPGEIAFIAPYVDKMLEYTLRGLLLRDGVELRNITRSRRLIDAPYALALITVSLLAHPEWGLAPGYGDLLETVRLLLRLDAVRSAVLAEAVIARGGPGLPPLDAATRARIGFRAGERYDTLARWLTDYLMGEKLPFPVFLQKVFGEILAPLELQTDDLASCRQLLASAQRFAVACEALRNAEESIAPGRHFVEMLRRGTVAAESLEGEPNGEAVLLATPYAYLVTGRSSSYQFWLDIGSEGWFASDAKELTNPHVLSRRWSAGGRWDDGKDQAIRRQNAARTVRALARRCREGLFLAESAYSSAGYEQNGVLPLVFDRLLGVDGT